MGKSKRICILVFTLFFLTVLGGIGISRASAASVPADITGNWAYTQIRYLFNQGIISGYPNGTFKPNNSVTRAEFISMINRAFGYNTKSAIYFSDVKTSDWFYDDIAKATAAGYISGYVDGTMRPNNLITREEAAFILAQAAKLNLYDGYLSFTDAHKIAAWSRNAISAMAQAGYIQGYPDGTFRPTSNISRAETAVMIYRTTVNQVVAVKGVSINKSTLRLDVDQSETLVATVSPGNATNQKVDWSSSRTSVATVSSTGRVKGIKEGTATITATTQDGNYTDTCKVTVDAGGAADAEITSNSIPSSMTAGESYSVSIKVKNTGTTTWTAAKNYKLGAVGDSDPFTSNERLSLKSSDSIAPGESKTFTFTMRAPNSAGTYTTDWRMLQEGEAWFGETLTKKVTVYTSGAVSGADADIMANTIPATMTAGQSYSVSITVKNTGNKTWTAANNYKLGAVGDSDPFASYRQRLKSSDSIDPGESKTFTFTMTAPASAGTYTTDWRMLKEGAGWFGKTLTKYVTVYAAAQIDDAQITGNTIPASMTAGQSYSVTVTVRNSGTTTWTAANNYKLGAVGDSDPFALNRQILDGNDAIAPGQSKAFTFTMTAPATAGTYTTDWSMLREGAGWFGQTLTKSVTVNAVAPIDDAQITGNTIPASMTAGQSYSVTVTVRNSGTTTWTAADNYKLGAAGDSDPFASNRQFLEGNDAIAPGQSKIFSFTMTAPVTAGTYTTDWSMLREGLGWFGQTLTRFVTVNPLAPIDDAQITDNTIPVTMAVGESYSVSITVANTGTTTWTTADRYRLGAVGDVDPFASIRQFLDSSDAIAPGESKTFSFTMTAPAGAGTYATDWRMLREGVGWFGAIVTVDVTVS